MEGLRWELACPRGGLVLFIRVFVEKQLGFQHMRPQVQTDGESLTAHTKWMESVLCIISSATISMLTFNQGSNHPLRFLRNTLETIHDNLLDFHLQHVVDYRPMFTEVLRFDDWCSDRAALSIEECVRAFLSYRDVAYSCMQDLNSLPSTARTDPAPSPSCSL